MFIIGFGLNFIFGGITHFFARLVFSGTATYPETMKIYFYSMLPTALLGTLPFGLGILALIYSIILGTIGISKTHNIGYGKSFVSVIAPWVLILILFISLIILAMSFYMGF